MICILENCQNETTRINAKRCDDHKTTCVFPGCKIPSTLTRCSKHAGRYMRLGEQYAKCQYHDCTEPVFADEYRCEKHIKPARLAALSFIDIAPFFE